jgi:hypothetical protein
MTAHHPNAFPDILDDAVEPRTERERLIYWATLHASEGCEASARELAELLSYDPAEHPDELVDCATLRANGLLPVRGF